MRQKQQNKNFVVQKQNKKWDIDGYLYKVIRPLVFILPKISGYGNSKVKNGDKDKNNKLMSLHADDDNLLEKYQITWTKIEDLKNIELNALPVYDHRYIETKIKTYSDKFCTNFRGLNVPEDGVRCESFTVISVDSLPAYNSKFYLPVYLNNCAYNIVDK